MLQNK